MDIADEAQRYEEAFIGRALARQAQAVRSGTASAFECDECSDEIPAARRVAIPGVRLCVYCQEDKERRAALSRGTSE